MAGDMIRKLVRTPQSHLLLKHRRQFVLDHLGPSGDLYDRSRKSAPPSIIKQTTSTSTGPDRLTYSGSEPTPLTLSAPFFFRFIKCSDGLARRKWLDLAENMTSRRVLVLKALLNMADDCTRLVRRTGQPDQSLIAKLSAGNMGASSKTSGCHDASETLCLRRQHRYPGRTGDAFTWVDWTARTASDQEIQAITAVPSMKITTDN
ncbi:hypothetical protein PGT21_016270 [Puccinia graminis f. sp. tritici]|uniref:Uncharacterized protein n=1 Tax=Puccinia graminis f. sp. tritici TaxID=56615 RepID=A0A5B0LVZ0_PUCGR|nr:hypothetical protein PGT21_016270 [Puccinia graminis f. sp. tritici]